MPLVTYYLSPVSCPLYNGVMFIERPTKIEYRKIFTVILAKTHLDASLFLGLLLLACFGLIILSSAIHETPKLFDRQLIGLALSFLVMCGCAQLKPRQYQILAPWLFGAITILLLTVLCLGIVSKGAQRWLNIGLLRFQPSEIMKIAMPLMLAWYFKNKILPPKLKDLFICSVIILIPAIIIAKQPDLGTAIIVVISGIVVLLLAGTNWRILTSLTGLILLSCPLAWHFMHDYQKERLLVFLNPENDPLGSGYNIIQSKIAIGSGGLFGKGLLHGTQIHLQFLPTHATDFIFAVCGEELGFAGCAILIAIFFYILIYSLYISYKAPDTFSRLATGGIGFTFFASFFVNMGMVTGLLPVVGLPLPLVSFGGTSLVTTMAAFGILMAIHANKKLF